MVVFSKTLVDGEELLHMIKLVVLNKIYYEFGPVQNALQWKCKMQLSFYQWYSWISP